MRDDRMMIRADAKAQGAITAISPRASERWKSSGTRSGECVSIFPDGTRIPFVRTRKTETPKINRIRAISDADIRRRLQRIATTKDHHNYNEQ